MGRYTVYAMWMSSVIDSLLTGCKTLEPVDRIKGSRDIPIFTYIDLCQNKATNTNLIRHIRILKSVWSQLLMSNHIPVNIKRTHRTWNFRMPSTRELEISEIHQSCQSIPKLLRSNMLMRKIDDMSIKTGIISPSPSPAPHPFPHDMLPMAHYTVMASAHVLQWHTTCSYLK